MQLIRALIMIAALAAPAHAFDAGGTFDQPAFNTDTGEGGGGIAFTGAPRWANHGCDVCHTGAPHRISIELDADDTTVFTNGWQPGKQYHLQVKLLGETLGLAYRPNGDACATDNFKPCDNNGFGLELDGETGQPAGTLAYVDAAGKCTTTAPAAGSSIYVMPTGPDNTGGAVFNSGTPHDATAWDLCWTAPPAGAGTITAYMSVVDGNGGDGTDKFPSDVTGDDVATGAVPLAERNANGDTQQGGCSATGDDASSFGAAFAILAVVAGLRRRRRGLALVIAIAAMVGGCVHVRPRQRETLARKNMQFGPDPGEDELDLHMQEAREGSTGGYGSSGGGCGCN